MLDIPWRVKLLLPTVASLPLLIAYSGATAVSIPKPVQVGGSRALWKAISATAHPHASEGG